MKITWFQHIWPFNLTFSLIFTLTHLRFCSRFSVTALIALFSVFVRLVLAYLCTAQCDLLVLHIKEHTITTNLCSPMYTNCSI